jgi:hypothetical protein
MVTFPGSLLSEAETRDFRMAEVQTNRTETQGAQRFSPSLRMSFKTPEQGKGAEAAIEVVMDASARDILSLDGRDASGRRRREVSCNTSLDLRPKASLSEELEGILGHDESYQAQHNYLEDILEAGAACGQ